MADVKYLIYQSKSKIEMLKEQISKDLLETYEREIESKSNVGFLSGSIKTVNKYKSSFNDIEIIISELNKQGEIDSIGRKPYVRANAQMAMKKYEPLECAYWYGNYYPRRDIKCVILMAGSQSNLLGSYVGQPNYVSPSSYDFYKELLSDVLEIPNEERHKMLSKKEVSVEYFAEKIYEFTFIDDYEDDKISNFEFVAKVFRNELFNNESILWEDFVSDKERNIKWLNILYASPLYVAMIPDETNVITVNGEKRISVTKSRMEELMPSLPITFVVCRATIEDYKKVYENLVSNVTRDLYDVGMFEEVYTFYSKIEMILQAYQIKSYKKLYECLDSYSCYECDNKSKCKLCTKKNNSLLNNNYDEIIDIFQQIYEIVKCIYIIQENWF